ncbi:hypothetical protein BGZ65_005864 [Modicella reniformis]|uniref:Uncharacterized protein n=1 Tax=Modicella reniformis TaxID=1440133 RepID=A0A9P6M8J6_9FUNG|nr:hypothetical protein BGZ65_005864 [Modicella reniformis]
MSDISDVFGQEKTKKPVNVISIIVERPRQAGQDLKLPTRYQHNFYDRAKFFETIIPDIIDNYHSRGLLEHKSHTTFLLPGGSGIGKSRAAFELQRLVSHAEELKIDLEIGTDTFRTALQNSCYLYVNLKNECDYVDDIDEHHGADVRLGTRLTVAAGLGSLALDGMRKYPLDLFTAENVIQEILARRINTSGRTLEAIIIHIDEYQAYIRKAQNEGERTWEQACEHFKEMLMAIGNVMSISRCKGKEFFIIPICTGLSTINMESYYAFQMIMLSRLSHDSAIRMFCDKYEKSNLCIAVQEQHHFRIALSDTGYIPGFLDFLLDPVSLSLNYDWGNRLFQTVTLKYFSDNSSHWGYREDVHAIISLGLTRKDITREFILPSGKTIREIERVGLLYLDAVHDLERLVVVMMPFVLLKSLNLMLEEPVIPDHLLLIPTKDRSWSWKDFETLVGHLQKAMINALINVRNTILAVVEDRISKLQKQGEAENASEDSLKTHYLKLNIAAEEVLLEKAKVTTLSHVFRGAKGSASVLERQVRLQPMTVFEEATKSLVLKDDILSLNSSVLCEDKEHHELDKGIFKCAVGNAALDYRWVMESNEGKPLAVFLQVKQHSELCTTEASFNHTELGEWYNAIDRSTCDHNKDHDVVIVIITNGRYIKPDGEQDDQDGIPDMPKLLLIDKSCIEQYLSPTFAHRAIVIAD